MNFLTDNKRLLGNVKDAQIDGGIINPIKHVSSTQKELQKQNAALLEALEGLYQMVQENYHVDDNNMKFVNAAYAAIAAAKGEA